MLRFFFRKKESSLQQLLDKIKLQTFWWLKANCNIAFNYHLWHLNPLNCLGIFFVMSFLWLLFLLSYCWCNCFDFPVFRHSLCLNCQVLWVMKFHFSFFKKKLLTCFEIWKVKFNTHTNKGQFDNINTPNRHINYNNNFS